MHSPPARCLFSIWLRTRARSPKRLAKPLNHHSQIMGFANLFGERALVRSHIEKRHLAGGECIRHLGDDGVAQLAFEIGHMINITSAADLAVERFSIAQVIRINAEAAKTDGAEFLVADGNGILR